MYASIMPCIYMNVVNRFKSFQNNFGTAQCPLSLGEWRGFNNSQFMHWIVQGKKTFLGPHKKDREPCSTPQSGSRWVGRGSHTECFPPHTSTSSSFSCCLFLHCYQSSCSEYTQRLSLNWVQTKEIQPTTTSPVSRTSGFNCFTFDPHRVMSSKLTNIQQ